MFKTLLSQVKEYKLPSVLTPLFMIGEVICEMIIPVLMGRIVDIGIGGSDMSYIIKTGAFMVFVALLGLLATGFAKNLRKAMYDNIQTFSFASIDKFSSSSLVTRLTTDVTNIQNAYQMLLRMAMRAPFSMIIAMAMSFIISPRLASIYLIAVIFLAIVISFVMRRATKYFQQVFRRYDDLNASVQENVSAIRVVKAYVREDYEKDRFHTAAENIYEMFIKAEMNIAGVMPVMMSVVYACILLISWFGAHMIISKELGTGELMSLLAYCMNILMSLMMLSMVFVMLTMSEASAKRIAEVINERSDLTNPENPVMEVPDGSIVFEDVDFSYRPGTGDPVLSGTILDNLRWGDKDATEEECKRACRMACADEFIEKMPEGYNTWIEQGGTNVSGGQKQRLCIARALLKKPRILILDDSTSAVDTATDAKIRKAFREEIPGTTKLIIAQRISSVRDCDRIIVMDDGRVNGFGTHEELLENNDIYREVYESQVGAGGDADFDKK